MLPKGMGTPSSSAMLGAKSTCGSVRTGACVHIQESKPFQAAALDTEQRPTVTATRDASFCLHSYQKEWCSELKH